MKKYTMPDILPDKIDPEDWQDFIDSRIDIGHPLTPTGAKRTIKKLMTYSPQIIKQALSTAMERGYRGVFPESEKEIEQVGFIEKHNTTSWADDFEAPSNIHQIGEGQ